MPLRNSKGRFIKANSPVALGMAAQVRKAREAALAADQRRKDAARNGYRGPLTRAELIAN